MKYLKNIEISEQYRVSEDTVTNWIKSAKAKKINLELLVHKTRAYIVDSNTNHILLKDLAEKGKKFKNKRFSKTIKPKNKFYEIFNEKQIIDIITNLEVNRELDLKFGYFKEGAKSFDDYVIRSLEEKGSNTPTNTTQLLDFNSYYIYSLIENYKNVNVVDIGPGNAQPIKFFLEFLIKKRMLNKYIAIDYSSDMIEIASDNLKNWFGKDFPFESYIKDVNYELFQDLLFKKSSSLQENIETTNIVFFIGSTIENQKDYTNPLRVIKNSMGSSDIFILNHRLDTQNARLTLSFKDGRREAKKKDIDVIFMLLDLLNISEDLYEVDRYYDAKEKSRIIRVTLKTDINLELETSSFKKTVSLTNRDQITLYRHRHHTFTEVINILTETGFEVLHASKSLDQDQILVISRLKPA